MVAIAQGGASSEKNAVVGLNEELQGTGTAIERPIAS